LLGKPVCAGTAVAAAIAIYVVAGALTSVDQRLSRRADRGWRHHWKAHPAIWRVHSHSTGCRRGTGIPARSTGCRGAPALAGWRGCPVPTVSARSTGCRGAPALVTRSTGCRGATGIPTGWRGCPVPTVSARSTGCRGAPALAGWRGLPSSDGIGPLNWLLPRLSSVTRPSASVLMPCHSPNGRLLSQLVSSYPLNWLPANCFHWWRCTKPPERPGRYSRRRLFAWLMSRRGRGWRSKRQPRR
jgi:hypothetical protein